MALKGSLDKLAWQAIHAHPRPSGKPRGVAYTNRPRNYRELGDLVEMGVEWEIAWGEFLHEFMLYRSVSFFVEPPPESFPVEYQAMLAGTAEVLCDEFNLPVPVWVHYPQYTLPELWDPYEWMWVGLTEEENRRRVAKADPLYLKHNVVWQRRDLITL